jgi:uncharacterized protein (TIGR00251 family)
MTFYEHFPQGCRLSIRVTPRASQNKVGGVYVASDGREWLKVYVTAPAEDNKANDAVIALLAKQLKIAKSDIEIITGHQSRQKVLLLPASANLMPILPASARQPTLF